MTGIWLHSERTRIRAYHATARGTRSVIKIEIETDDPDELAYVLRQCAEAQKACRPKPAPTKKPAAKKALPPPPLLIGYREE